MTAATNTAMTHPDEERLYDAAERLAPFELEQLLGWVLVDRRAAALVDQTIAELGVPSPELDADGNPVTGSVLRQLLRLAYIEGAVRGWTDHGLTLAEASA